MKLWSADGQLLATGSAPASSAAGWREATFAQPVSVDAGDVLVATYHAPEGGYSINQNYFSQSFGNDSLTALQNGGVYAYGGSNAFPTQTWQSSNYWIDVVFDPADATSQASSGGSAAGSPYDLVVSDSANRSNPRDLQGAVLSDDAFIFVKGTENAQRVEFYLDDPAGAGSPDRVEYYYQHDFASGSATRANAWDTSSEAEGLHTMTLRIYEADGGQATISDSFIIDNF